MLKYILEKHILPVNSPDWVLCQFPRLGALRICISKVNIVRSFLFLRHFTCHYEFKCHIHNAGIALYSNDTVSRSQCNKVPFGCGGTGGLHVQLTNLQQLMLSCQNGPKSLRNVSSTLLNLCNEELRQL